MNKKGFAITGVLYVLLIIFLASLTMLLFHLQNRKILLDQLKLDAVEAVESENNYEYLLNRISDLEAKISAKYMVTEKLFESITLAGKSYKTEDIIISNNGYQAVGIVGYNTGNSSFYFTLLKTYVKDNESHLIYNIYNSSSFESTDYGFQIYVLWEKI